MRKHYIDNIRWITVALVLVYHVFYLFNHAGVLGGVTALEGAKYADALLYFVYPWFMVLLFFVAGISTRYSLNHRTAKQFIRGRAVKLLVPSTLGLFVYQWISGYFNLKIGGGLPYIPTLMRYPVFVISGIGPLWFIQMLFLFSLLMVAVRKLDRSDRLWSVCGKMTLPALLLLVLPIWGAAQILNLPVLIVYRFGIYFFAFLLGYFVFSHEAVICRLEKAKIPLGIAAVLLGVLYTLYYFGSDYTSAACLQSFFTNLYLWIAVLAVLGCAKAWLDFQSAFTSYMSKTSFGWYILHYPILLAVCYVLVHAFSLPAAAVYVIALAAEFALTAATFEILKRIPIVRFWVLGIQK